MCANYSPFKPASHYRGAAAHRARLGGRPGKAVTGASRACVAINRERSASSAASLTLFLQVHCPPTTSSTALQCSRHITPSTIFNPPTVTSAPDLGGKFLCCHQSITNHCWKRQFSERRKKSVRNSKSPPPLLHASCDYSERSELWSASKRSVLRAGTSPPGLSTPPTPRPTLL